MANAFRQRVKELYWKRLLNTAVILNDTALDHPTLIFAPHQDDESLACGGTILEKRRLGVDVSVVFMTDGRNSHPHFQQQISKAELAQTRQQEAIDACQKLNIPTENISFLNYEDHNLAAFHQEAVQKVMGQLEISTATQIFIPYAGDITPDHEATNRIVLDAIRQLGKPYNIFEYPIWFCHQWPFTNPFGKFRTGSKKRAYLQALQNRFGLKFLATFNHAVPIQAQLAGKKEALATHKTQTTRFIPNSEWPILADVSGGEFEAHFFQTHELFRCYQFPA